MIDPIYLSKKGMKELRRQIAQLERSRSSAITQLREDDKSESHDERLARTEKLAHLEILESELADKQLILSNAKPMPRKRDAFKVALGSVVDLLDTNGRIVRYTIVDSFEANPSDGRISARSPLGMNLLDKQLRDIVEWSAGLGRQRLQLIAIH